MGFSTSASNSRPSQIGQVVWGSKNPDLVTPNIAFYDKDTKETSHLLPAGTKGQVNVSGAIRRVSASPVESYNDREKKTGQKSLWRMYVTLDSGAEEPLAVLSFDVFDQSTGSVDGRGLDLVNSLHSHMQMVQSGQIAADAPVQIGFYRKVDGEKSYPNSIIRLPVFDAEGNAQFTDPKLFVKSDAFPPRGEPVMVNGKQVEANGVKVFDHTKAVEWVEGKIGALQEHYARETEAPADSAAPAEGEDGADLAGVAEAVAADRPRMAG